LSGSRAFLWERTYLDVLTPVSIRALDRREHMKGLEKVHVNLLVQLHYHAA
jgi:hypothetical protein